ncbi:haloalkane dehalogenase [Amycolatopsis sp. OK19-0408]|uniref:Haloalkane dehalogenase n=1 Tax=Amycolatopsis iheyensis TaxID=2945988 RepID=A0A9X2SIP3_9PSEU|nr:haloalkane dehalogenase [Amycolatopsis iheyensis]MCR6483158.1 haloalkane dehalogenase [Amycolatopsis iheyensis]
MDLHHEESGTGTPIVFLHGNPGSSHGWRHVLPHVGAGRLLAPDLIGMGRSAKPAIDYSFADHARYLDAWFDALGLDDVVLVGHDWGGALAFDWAARHHGRVRGLAFFETIVKPLAWEDLTPQAAERTRKIRTPGVGEEMVLEHNLAVRQAFTGGVRTPVADLEPYLAPFPTPESRRPLLAWARQLPVGGEPAGLLPRIEAYDAWLKTSTGIPKLLMTFEGSPTLLIGKEMARWCADNVASLEIVACGEAGHHAQEDRPKEIAAEIAAWLDRTGLR